MRDKHLEALLGADPAAIERTLGEGAQPAFAARARARCAALAPSAPRFRRGLNRGLFALGVPVLAIYRVLREEYGLAEPAALDLVWALLEARYLALGESRLIRAGYSAMMTSRLVKIGLRRALPKLTEESGFRMELVDDGGVLSFDVKACALVRYLRERGAPELGPLFCRIDDIMAGFIDGVALERSGTIAQGAERCDFRYRRR